MRKSFSTKLFACVMAVCMIFTMCAGVLSVSAAATAVVAISDVAIQAGDSDTVTVDVTATDALIGGAELYVTVPAGLTITGAELNAPESFTLDSSVDYFGIIKYVILDENGTLAGAANVQLVLTVAVAEDAEGTLEIVVSDAVIGAVDAGTIPADFTDTGVITVAAECQHTNVKTLEAVAPTCEATGLTEGSECLDCGVTIVAQEVVDALGHDWDEGVVDPDATCTDEGVITYTCKNDASHTYTEAISAKGHTPADELVNNGDNHSVVCAVCGAVLSTADHEYVDGSCACGAVEVTGPTIDDTLVFAGAAPTYGTSSLYVNFRIRNNLLTKYSNMELVIIPKKYDLTTLNEVTADEIVVPYANLAGTGTFRTYAYDDIMLYELGLEIQYMLRGTDTNGNAVQSPVYTTSVASYLKTLYESSTNSVFRTLLVDTLVVGAEAVKNAATSYPDSDLAAAVSIIDGFDIGEATPSVDSYNTIDVHNATNADWGNGSTGTHRNSKSVTIGKVPFISYRIRGGSSIDLDKLTVNVTYTQTIGVGTTAAYERTYTSADTANLYKQGSFVMFKFDEIGLGDSDKDITFTAIYDGAEVFNATYSIESYLGSNTSNATIGNLCTALLKLGISFRAYSAG